MRKFPTANKTFSVYRRLQTRQVGSNIVPVAALTTTPVASGLSIAIKDIQDVFATEKATTTFTGAYLASTFTDTPILLGDELTDETENDREGNPVRYAVQGLTRYAICVKLRLKRLDVGT